MKGHIQRGSAVAALLVLSSAAGTAAWGAATGRATAAQSVGTSGWGATPRALNSDAAPILDWSVVDQFLNPDKYFRVVNTGAETLTGMTWTITVTRTSGSGALRDIRFSSCPVAWNMDAGTCQGGSGSTIGTTSGTNAGTTTLTVSSTQVPAAPSAVLHIRAIPTQLGLSNFAASVSIAVNSATQIKTRTATVTNS